MSDFYRRSRQSLLCLGLLGAQQICAEQLTIDVLGIKKTGGALMIAVYSSADAWDSDGGVPAATARDPVTGDTARVVLGDLAPGAHAVKLYHDENGNGKLDSNMLGIPSEGYGFSRWQRGLGAPDFDEAMFMVNGDTEIRIILN